MEYSVKAWGRKLGTRGKAKLIKLKVEAKDAHAAMDEWCRRYELMAKPGAIRRDKLIYVGSGRFRR